MADTRRLGRSAFPWKNALAFLVCGGVATFVVLANVQSLTSGYPVQSPQPFRPHWLAAPIAAGLLAAFLYCIAIGVAGRWRSWHASARIEERWFGAALFAVLLGLYSVVIGSQAPGWFPEDVLYTLHMVRSGWWSGWYSPLHPLLYTALLQIVPSMLFVTICNAAVAAFVLAMYGRELALLGMPRRWAAATVLVIAVLPPTLVMILTPVRDSFFASGFLLFCLLILRAYRGADAGAWAIARLLLLGGCLAAYRVDALPAIVLAYAALAFAPAGRRHFKTFVASAALSLVAILAVSAAIPAALERAWDDRAEREYKLTLVAHPLTYFVQEGQFYTRSERDLDAIEQVFPRAQLQKYWNPYNIAVFYHQGWNQSSTLAQREAAFRSALVLFADNPGLYLASKFRLFMRSSGLQENERYAYTPITALASRNVDAPSVPSSLRALGERVESFLHASQDFHGLSLRGRMVWWNLIVPNFLLLVVVLSWSRSKAIALVASVLLLRELVVTVLAPATFVHYYFPVFVGGYLVAALAVAWRRTPPIPRSGQAT